MDCLNFLSVPSEPSLFFRKHKHLHGQCRATFDPVKPSALSLLGVVSPSPSPAMTRTHVEPQVLQHPLEPERIDPVATPPPSDCLTPSQSVDLLAQPCLHPPLAPPDTPGFRSTSSPLVSHHYPFATDLQTLRYALFLHPYGCGGLPIPFRFASILHHTDISSVLS